MPEWKSKPANYEQICEHVLSEMVAGRNVPDILEQDQDVIDNLPKPATFWNWRVYDPALREAYTRVLKESAHAYFQLAVQTMARVHMCGKTRYNLTESYFRAAAILQPDLYSEKRAFKTNADNPKQLGEGGVQINVQYIGEQRAPEPEPVKHVEAAVSYAAPAMIGGE